MRVEYVVVPMAVQDGGAVVTSVPHDFRVEAGYMPFGLVDKGFLFVRFSEQEEV